MKAAEAECQVCGETIGEDRVYCNRCQAPHHPECWDFNHGCAIFGCGGTHCFQYAPAGSAAPETIVIEERADLDLPPPPRARSVSHWWASPRFAAVAFFVAVVMSGLFEDKPAPSSRRSTWRPSRREATRPAAQPFLYEALLRGDVKNGDGTVAVPAGARVRVYAADRDGRHRIEAPGLPPRWVYPGSLQPLTGSVRGTEPPQPRPRTPPREAPQAVTFSPMLFTQPTPAGEFRQSIVQVVRDLPDVPMGELLLLVDEREVRLRNLGFNITTRQFSAVTGKGRKVSVGPRDFETLPGSPKFATRDEGLLALRQTWLALATGKSDVPAIMVESVEADGRSFEIGALVRVDQVEQEKGLPTTCLVRRASETGKVPAGSCQPLLARKLIAQARNASSFSRTVRPKREP